MTVLRTCVGDVLRAERALVTPDPTREYVAIGLRSFGKGIFHYAATSGDQLGNLRFYDVRSERLVISNIKGWEGAIAVSSDLDAGCIASNRFLQYVPRDGRIDIRWAGWFFQSEAGLALIQKASPGSADRNRTLAINRFEDLEIPLPIIDEQTRVAAWLDQLSANAATAVDRTHHASEVSTALADAMTRAFLQRGIDAGWDVRPLGAVAEVNPRPERLNLEQHVTFVPMAAVDARAGTVSNAGTRLVHEVRTGYKQFRRGDVIFARITPCMQNGKAAIFQDADYGYGSSEFHILRPGEGVTAEWLHAIVRTRDFRNAAATRFTGTAGQQRVPAEFLESYPIPLPPVREQSTLADSLVRQRAGIEQVQRHRIRAATLANAIVPAALNEAFAGLS
jgi:type I restriction enzyme S subunit